MLEEKESDLVSPWGIYYVYGQVGNFNDASNYVNADYH